MFRFTSIEIFIVYDHDDGSIILLYKGEVVSMHMSEINMT